MRNSESMWVPLVCMRKSFALAHTQQHTNIVASLQFPNIHFGGKEVLGDLTSCRVVAMALVSVSYAKSCPKFSEWL